MVSRCLLMVNRRWLASRQQQLLAGQCSVEIWYGNFFVKNSADMMVPSQLFHIPGMQDVNYCVTFVTYILFRV
jgi:hypothetical protein